MEKSLYLKALIINSVCRSVSPENLRATNPAPDTRAVARALNGVDLVPLELQVFGIKQGNYDNGECNICSPLAASTVNAVPIVTAVQYYQKP
jgi:hypothetical protein